MRPWLVAITCGWLSSAGAQEAAEMVKRPGAEAGLAVIVEPVTPNLAGELARGGRHVVAIVSADRVKVRMLDDALVAARVHPVADAHPWYDTARLPFRDHAVNLLVADPATMRVDEAELARVIAPGYGVALVREGRGWREIRKPRPEGMDVWLGWFSRGSGHMGSRDALVEPPNSVQFLGGPRNLRGTPHLATDRVALNNAVARDAFTGVIRWTRGEIDTLGDGAARGDFSDGRHLFRVQGIAGGKLPVLDLLTGLPIHGGIALGAVEKSPEPGREVTLLRGREICADVERAYWRGGLRAVRAARTATGERLWEREFSDPVEAIVTDGKIVAVLLVEDLEKRHEGLWIRHNVAKEIVALDPASGRELWRSAEFAGQLTLHFAAEFGAVVASTDICGDNPDPPGNQYKEQTRIRAALRQRNCLVALESLTGKLRFKRTDFADAITSGGRKHFSLQADRILVMADEGLIQQFDLRTGRTIGQTLQTNPGGLDGMREYRAQYYASTPHYLIHQALGGIRLEDGGVPVNRHGPKINWVWYDSLVKPANGMLYYPPRINSSKGDKSVGGAQAMIARTVPRPLPDERRALLAGKVQGAAEPGVGDWPTFRGNFDRAAWTDAQGPAEPKLAWEARLALPPVPPAARLIELGWRFNGDSPGPVSQPVADAENVLVAVPDAHRVDCLRLADGKLKWSTRLGGRITGPPTISGRAAYVGCHDGTVTALDLADGRPIWSFLAAQNGDLLVACDQVENLGPVRSAPVVLGETVYVAAGRHSLMEDGIALYALDASTGAMRKRVMLDGATFEATREYAGGTLLQTVGGKLRFGDWLIDPATLDVTLENRGVAGVPGRRPVMVEWDRRHPVPYRGDHAGGTGWMRPSDQYVGYRNPLQTGGGGPHSSSPVVCVRADGLLAVADPRLPAIDVTQLDAPTGKVPAGVDRFEVLQAGAGAGDRLYLAGRKDRSVALLTVELAQDQARLAEVPGLAPASLGILPDGIPWTSAYAHALSANTADREHVIPDGIAIAHGRVIVTTTAGRVLAFQ